MRWQLQWAGAALAVVICGAEMCLCVEPAQASNASSTLSITEVRSLAISPDSLTYTPSGSEMLAGATSPQDIVATVRANTGWSLKVKGSSSTWSGGSGFKDVSDIRYSTDGGSSYTGLSTSDASIGSGGAIDPSNTTVKVKVLLHLATDTPGNYSYNSIVFTLTN